MAFNFLVEVEALRAEHEEKKAEYKRQIEEIEAILAEKGGDRGV